MATLVRDWMVTGVETLTPESTLDEAVRLEMKAHIRHIPIVEQGILVGIVTDRDLKRAMPSLLSGIERTEYDRVMKTTKVAQIMTRSPQTIRPDASLAAAVKLMCDRKFGALPVVDGQQLIGIITQTDMLRAFQSYLD